MFIFKVVYVVLLVTIFQNLIYAEKTEIEKETIFVPEISRYFALPIRNKNFENNLKIFIRKTKGNEKRYMIFIYALDKTIINLKFKIYLEDKPITEKILVSNVIHSSEPISFFLETNKEIKSLDELNNYNLFPMFNQKHDCFLYISDMEMQVK